VKLFAAAPALLILVSLCGGPVPPPASNATPPTPTASARASEGTVNSAAGLSPAAPTPTATPPGLAFGVRAMQIVSPAFAWNLTGEHLFRWTPFPNGAAGVGLNLQDVAPPSISAADIKGVHFLDPNNGWLIANGATDVTGATQLVAYRTSDGGKSWESFPLGTAKKLYAQTLSHTAYIDFVALDKGWVVLDVTGTGGFDSYELWHTDDGGKSWTKLSTDVSAPVNFTSAQDGWASGRRATHDGGKSWDSGVDIVPICPPPGCDLVLHGAPIRIDDGRLFDLASTLSVSGLVSLELDQSTDGGQTWTSLAASGSIAARSATVPVTQVLPDGTVIAITTDGTAGLRHDPETATFERFSVTGLDPVIDIDFLKDRGLALVNRFGLNDIEQTEDGGRTWARVAEGL
jgi:hypothetical protein